MMIAGTISYDRCARMFLRPPRDRGKGRPTGVVDLSGESFAVALTVADTCWINRHLPAREIARRLGITRNAVIGYWFRARQKLEQAAP